MERYKKKKGTPKIILYIFIIYLTLSALFFVFLIGSAVSYSRPVKNFDAKTRKTCEEQFGVRFNDSFTPVEFAHEGIRDSVYKLWVKDIDDYDALMKSAADNLGLSCVFFDEWAELDHWNRIDSFPEGMGKLTPAAYCSIGHDDPGVYRIRVLIYEESGGKYAAYFERAYF